VHLRGLPLAAAALHTGLLLTNRSSFWPIFGIPRALQDLAVQGMQAVRSCSCSCLRIPHRSGQVLSAHAANLWWLATEWVLPRAEA
jgi:hypothetical protein